MAAPWRLMAVRRLLESNILSVSAVSRTRAVPKPVTISYRFLHDLKKFYKSATITSSNGWFEINLDKRKLKTPSGGVFRVQNEALALAVATEWNAQEDTIKRHNMHLTSLCNTAIDNPMHKTKADLIKSILHFLETDTICYRMSDPPDLVALQDREWNPVLDWASQRYGIQLQTTTGIASPEVPQATMDIVEKHLQSYTELSLVGFQWGVDAVKSLLLVLAVVDKALSVEDAVRLSRLEQEYQSTKWGIVEWHHDVDKFDHQARLAAATLFVHWTSEKISVQRKATMSSRS